MYNTYVLFKYNDCACRNEQPPKKRPYLLINAMCFSHNHVLSFVVLGGSRIESKI